MTCNNAKEEEQVISTHSANQWKRRKMELANWVRRPKHRRRAKQTAYLGNIEVDVELLQTLTLLKRMNIQTEFSCAGVSVLDDPENHSFYGYMTLIASDKTEKFMQLAIQHMRQNNRNSIMPMDGLFISALYGKILNVSHLIQISGNKPYHIFYKTWVFIRPF
jgi:hypothetical protein